MDTIAERLRAARVERNLTQLALADSAGVTSAAISALEKGLTKSPTPETLFPLARKLAVSPEWLITGKGDRDTVVQSHQILRSEIPPGYLRFQVMGIGGAGPGMINSDEPEVLEEVDLAEWQVRKEIGHIVSPSRVKLLTVRGTSMMPKIRHGDVVFVDIEDRAPMDGGIFVVLVLGHALVKRIEIHHDGYHVVSLADPDRPKVFGAGQLDDIGIAGRVLGAIQLRRAEDL